MILGAQKGVSFREIKKQGEKCGYLQLTARYCLASAVAH